MLLMHRKVIVRLLFLQLGLLDLLELLLVLSTSDLVRALPDVLIDQICILIG